MTRKSKIDPTQPPVKVILSGETYSLLYSFSAICTAEELTGMELLESITLQGLSARKYAAMLYSALLTYHPDITLDEVRALITVANLSTISNGLVAAWVGSMPEPDKSEIRPPEPASN